ncbi:uncharacterized protein LOC34622836 [Cyclospora cayetanensis]|uniref:Uncharacterized protein LOC34622836 n=1 Tax=Cyclospora cayetanensis TaxID=88456 RepID=A0A6P6S0K6_9EIME|nr:uncharacterized protein LOC34622836 [Cyclospora cayetanensis]
MGKYSNLVSRLVSNSQLKITQTAKVCPKQLLDAALLAPVVPPHTYSSGRDQAAACLATSGASPSYKRRSLELIGHASEKRNDVGSTISGEPSTEAFTKATSIWATLETHAMLALPSLSPSGILQFMFLALRGNYTPVDFIQELHQYLLTSEPAAPPVEAFWQLWTANDIALLCKLLVGLSEGPLVLLVCARIACCLPHFLPQDSAIVINAMAADPSSYLTKCLVQPLNQLIETASHKPAAAAEKALLIELSRHLQQCNGPHEAAAHTLNGADPTWSLFQWLLTGFTKQAGSPDVCE